jgi:hypothetical protein
MLTLQDEVSPSPTPRLIEGLVKWYIIGSAILGFTPSIVAAARGRFAGSSTYNTWYVFPFLSRGT